MDDPSWGSVGLKRVGKRAACEGRTNAERSKEGFKDKFIQGAKVILGKKESQPFIFQHVNATLHRSICTKIYQCINTLSALPWLA